MITIRRLDDGILATSEQPDLRAALVSLVKRGAYLQGAYLQGADLRGANLRGADLQDADLQGADLQDADGSHRARLALRARKAGVG